MSHQQKQQLGNDAKEEDIRSIEDSEWSMEDENIGVGDGNAKQKAESNQNLKIALLEANNKILEGKLENMKLLAENRALKEEANLNKLNKENKAIREQMKEAEKKTDKLESTVKEIQQEMDKVVKEMTIQNMQHQKKMQHLEGKNALFEKMLEDMERKGKMDKNELMTSTLPPSESRRHASIVQDIVNKIREAKTAEEREAMFADLKKTPHLFNEFLKMTKRPDFNKPEVSALQQQMMVLQPTGFGPNNEGTPPPLPPSEFREWLASIMPDPHTSLVSPNDISLIMNKIREAKTCEEREAMFADVKKRPHLFNQFLEMTKTVIMTEVSAQQQQQRHQQ